ncbi:hypothetical protein DFJ74DRAFT_468578 [Hyaloraphidium curvatum]|nr:hypothetical protein DFJ74DRAFT_468578 [Hyaloraphidium curvatum]
MTEVWAHVSFSRCIGRAVHEEIGNRRLLMFDFAERPPPRKRSRSTSTCKRIPVEMAPRRCQTHRGRRCRRRGSLLRPITADTTAEAPWYSRTMELPSATCHRRHSAERWPSSQYVARKNDSKRISVAQGPMLRTCTASVGCLTVSPRRSTGGPVVAAILPSSSKANMFCPRVSGAALASAGARTMPRRSGQNPLAAGGRIERRTKSSASSLAFNLPASTFRCGSFRGDAGVRSRSPVRAWRGCRHPRSISSGW